jgi:HK97 family phage portal protein
MSDLGLPGNQPYEILLNQYGNYIWVNIATSRVATAHSQVDYRVIDKRKENQPHDSVKGPAQGLNDLLARPNPWMSMVEFKEMAALHLLLTGNVYIEKAEMDVRGRPRELYLLNPKNMKVVPDPKKFVRGYKYIVNDQVINFKPDEIIHVKLPDPRGESHYGVSPLQAGRFVLHMDGDAITWNLSYFQNATWPSGIIVSQEGLSESEFKRAKRELKENYEGRSKVGKVMVLAGGLDWKQTTPNPKDLDFLKLRQHCREEILSLFGVPPSIAGIFAFENSTSRSAGTREQHVQFWSQTIRPLAQRFIEQFNQQLCPSFSENYKIVADVSRIPALKETEEMKLTRANAAARLVMQAGWSPADAKSHLYPDIPSTNDWDEEPPPGWRKHDLKPPKPTVVQAPPDDPNDPDKNNGDRGIEDEDDPDQRDEDT